MSLDRSHTTGLIPDTHLDLLEMRTVAQLATVGRHGEANVNPVWFVWDGERVVFSLTTTRQKYRNLRRTGTAAVCISDPADQFRYLELRGPVIIEDDPDRTKLDAIAQKYLQIPRYPWHVAGEERMIGRLSPERVSFGHLPDEYRVGISAIERTG